MYNFFRILKLLLPKKAEIFLGKSPSLRFVRDRFFRPHGVPIIAEGRVQWEDLVLHFSAPYQVLYQAQKSGIENRICRLAYKTLRDGGFGIDVGANYGFVTLVMGKSLRPGEQVLSFELMPEIQKVLRRNVRRNSLENLVKIIPQGVGDGKTAQRISLDSMVGEHITNLVSFIKIDIDGEDYFALKGARFLLLRDHPVIVIEMSRKKSEILSFLKEVGYSYFIDLDNVRLDVGRWPENLIAATEPVVIPPRGSFAKGGFEMRVDVNSRN